MMMMKKKMYTIILSLFFSGVENLGFAAPEKNEDEGRDQNKGSFKEKTEKSKTKE
jgi:hypothetical protein